MRSSGKYHFYDIRTQQLPSFFSIIGNPVDVIGAGYDGHGPSFKDLVITDGTPSNWREYHSAPLQLREYDLV